ncbi:MAG: hypothetical protein WCF95_06725, partial [bacterium]
MLFVFFLDCFATARNDTVRKAFASCVIARRKFISDEAIQNEGKEKKKLGSLEVWQIGTRNPYSPN